MPYLGAIASCPMTVKKNSAGPPHFSESLFTILSIKPRSKSGKQVIFSGLFCAKKASFAMSLPDSPLNQQLRYEGVASLYLSLSWPIRTLVDMALHVRHD